jgi:hypothetical protein
MIKTQEIHRHDPHTSLNFNKVPFASKDLRKNNFYKCKIEDSSKSFQSQQ